MPLLPNEDESEVPATALLLLSFEDAIGMTPLRVVACDMSVHCCLRPHIQKATTLFTAEHSVCSTVPVALWLSALLSQCVLCCAVNA